MRTTATLFTLLLLVVSFTSRLTAQVVLFDFDNAPLLSSLPIDQTVSGITAHLSATGQGYSIQEANVLGFTPKGFAGRIIWPNSIYLADLLIRFDQALTDFSIMYACNELACDDAATMRVTAYMKGSLVGTNTKAASVPGTWPVDTLGCSFPQGFDSVVVHYDSPPPTCQNYGVVYVADNMRVTLFNVNAVSEGELAEMFTLTQNYPNPFNPSTKIQFTIVDRRLTIVKVFDLLGREVATLVNEVKEPGTYSLQFDGSNLASGVYLYRFQARQTDGGHAGDYVQTRTLVLVR